MSCKVTSIFGLPHYDSICLIQALRLFNGTFASTREHAPHLDFPTLIACVPLGSKDQHDFNLRAKHSSPLVPEDGSRQYLVIQSR